MKIKYLASVLIPVVTLFSSCVGEDTVFVEELSNSVSFDRQLRSIAADEDFALNLIFRDANNNIINDQSNFIIDYSSDNTDILIVSDEGVISTPKDEENTTASAKTTNTESTTTIRINARTTDFIFPEIADEITVGRVTISESEAQLKGNEEEVARIISQGYTPVVTITNRISQIGIDSEEIIQLNGNYQNLKRELEDVLLTWESDDSNILAINNDGILTPISTGITTITASFNDIQSSLEIEVTEDDEVVVITEEPVDPVATTEVIGFGMLQSNSSYDLTGNFQIIQENGITTLTLDDTYETAGLPDLVIYLSNVTNTNNGASIISEDITASGEQSFIIPDSINSDDYINVLLYCRRFGQRVGFGVINR